MILRALCLIGIHGWSHRFDAGLDKPGRRICFGGDPKVFCYYPDPKLICGRCGIVSADNGGNENLPMLEASR